MEDKSFDYEFNHLKNIEIFVVGKHVNIIKVAIIGDEGVYMGYSNTTIKMGKYPFHNKFSQAFDIEIYKMNKLGEIDKIIKKYKE